MARIASDWHRGVQVIRDLRLRSPGEGVGTFRIPQDRAARVELVDVIYDLTDEHAARAVLDGPTAVILWEPLHP